MAEAPAFATATDLATRLGREVWDGPEADQIDELLADASAHLRAIIGWQVSPPATVTTRVRSEGTRRLPLSGSPITAVTAVTLDGQAILTDAYELVEGELWTTACALPYGAAVTYEVGYPDPPRELVSWTCVLASQALSVLEELGALGGGGVATIAIDDFRKSWHEGAEGAGFVLPARVEQQLRSRYGSGGVFVTDSRSATGARP